MSPLNFVHAFVIGIPPPTGIQSCNKFGFACLDGSCVDKNAVCDGNVDCADGADELQCGELGIHSY